MSYDKKGFALQYPNGRLVALDVASGGYPWEAPDVQDVWVTSRERLEQYLKAGNSEQLTIVPITITVQVT